MKIVTTPSRHQAHDRLLTRIRLSERRLARLATELDEDDELREGEFPARVEELQARATELADSVRSWTEVEVGMLTAVDDLAAAIDSLQTDLSAVRATDRIDYEEAIDRQVRTWRTRIDRLRLQGDLASMEARDGLDALVHRLEDARATALDGLQEVSGDARETVIELRSGVDRVLVDVRKAVEQAAASLTRSD